MYKFTRAEVFGPGGHPVASARFLLAGSLPAHSHDFLELAFVLAGSGAHVSRGGDSDLREGSVVLVRPGQWHGYRECSDLDVFNLYLGPELAHHELSWLFDFPALARFFLQGGQLRTELSSESRSQVASWLEDLGGRTPQKVSASSIISLGLASCVLGKVAEIAASDDAPAQPLSQPVRDALSAMYADLAHSWTIAELARLTNISSSHLQHSFTAQVGSPPMSWLAGVRAERAAMLLIQTDLTTTEIGRQVGWSDGNYASRRFRQAYGTSPRQYRVKFRNL
jgi:AraC family L-rhamnose operon transcriptional activator RhaR